MTSQSIQIRSRAAIAAALFVFGFAFVPSAIPSPTAESAKVTPATRQEATPSHFPSQPSSTTITIDSPSSSTLSGRDPAWAVPLNRPGLPNLYKVSDNLYRGAQPTAEGFRELKKMGVKTVINLRALHSDRKLIGNTGLRYVSIPCHAWHAEDEDVVKFLKTVNDPNQGPFFVHCEHGSDRTGTMCAAYRIVVEGWTKDQAIREMTHGGYGFHSLWENLIHYIRKLDIEKIRKKAGLPTRSI